MSTTFPRCDIWLTAPNLHESRFGTQLRLLLMRLECNTFDLGLYPHSSFFNHSCRPTAQGFAVHGGLAPMLEVVAISDLDQGGEVAVSYLSDQELCLPTDQRQANLVSYGFVCNCRVCTAEVYDVSEGVVCPTCGNGVCIYQPATDDTPDGLYTCCTPRRGGAPCGARHASGPIDAVIVQCFQAAGEATTTEPSASSLTALDTVCALLVTIAESLPPEHWITNIAATALSHLFFVEPSLAQLRRTHGLHWLAAEHIRLAATATSLQPFDYSLSNAHERLAEAWQAAGRIVAEGGEFSDCKRLWSLCVPHTVIYPPDATVCEVHAEKHAEAVRSIRAVSGWH